MTRSGKKQIQMKPDNKIRPITDQDPETTQPKLGAVCKRSVYISLICSRVQIVSSIQMNKFVTVSVDLCESQNRVRVWPYHSYSVIYMQWNK